MPHRCTITNGTARIPSVYVQAIHYQCAQTISGMASIYQKDVRVVWLSLVNKNEDPVTNQFDFFTGVRNFSTRKFTFTAKPLTINKLPFTNELTGWRHQCNIAICLNFKVPSYEECSHTSSCCPRKVALLVWNSCP